MLGWPSLLLHGVDVEFQLQGLTVLAVFSDLNPDLKGKAFVSFMIFAFSVSKSECIVLRSTWIENSFSLKANDIFYGLVL